MFDTFHSKKKEKKKSKPEQEMIMYLEQTQRSHAIKTNCCFIDFNSGQKKTIRIWKIYFGLFGNELVNNCSVVRS